MANESPFTSTAEPITSQERRALQRRAMAGYDPSQEEQAALDADMARLEGNAENLGGAGMELTGIPSIERGAGNVQQGWNEGDAIRSVGGVLQAAMGALPALGVTRAGAKAIAPLFSSVPRAAGTSAVAAAPIGYADEAAARDKNVAEAVLNDPVVKATKAERDNLQKELDAINLKHVKSPPITHQTAVGNRVKRLETLDKNVGEAEEVARKTYIDNAPFRERNPGMAPAIMGGGLAFAAGVPAVKEIVKAAGDKFWRGPAISEASKATAKAFASKDPVAAAQAQDVLRRKLGTWDASHGSVATVGTTAGNAAKGALVGAEASALPEQIDHVSFEPGHPTRDAADKNFRDPGYYVGRVAPAALGATAAIAGQTIGGMAKVKNPHLEEARSLADRGGRGKPVERMKEAVGISDPSAGSLARARMRMAPPAKQQVTPPDQAKPNARIAGGAETYTDAHKVAARETFDTHFDALAQHYRGASPEQRTKMLTEIKKMTGQPMQELREAFQGKGLGQPSDASLRSKAGGTLKEIEALARQGLNPFDPGQRHKIFGNGSKQLAVPAAIVGAGAAGSPFSPTDTEAADHHIWTQNRDTDGRLVKGFKEDGD